jgi:hypothetical protein
MRSQCPASVCFINISLLSKSYWHSFSGSSAVSPGQSSEALLVTNCRCLEQIAAEKWSTVTVTVTDSLLKHEVQKSGPDAHGHG